MSKYIIDLWLDGYENEEDRSKAEKEFIYEQLNMTASGVEIQEILPGKTDTERLNFMIDKLYSIDKRENINGIYYVVWDDYLTCTVSDQFKTPREAIDAAMDNKL